MLLWQIDVSARCPSGGGLVKKNWYPEFARRGTGRPRRSYHDDLDVCLRDWQEVAQNQEQRKEWREAQPWDSSGQVHLIIRQVSCSPSQHDQQAFGIVRSHWAMSLLCPIVGKRSPKLICINKNEWLIVLQSAKLEMS